MDRPQRNRGARTSEALSWRSHITGSLYKVSGSVYCVRGQGVGAMQVTPSTLPTTAPGYSEIPERAEPKHLIAGEGPCEPPTQVSHESAALVLGQQSGESIPTNDNDPAERIKSRRRRGLKKKSSEAVLVEAGSPPEAGREEEEKHEAREEGESWGEVLMEY